MEGDNAVAGTVVVNDQIVHAYDFRIGQHLLLDLLDKLRIGSLAQQQV